ncbi:MAG: hypothetical protein CFH22_00119 [Alphaproteobacteria bacterium MarineAlpha5_Bin12]|nr:hypothetical protein [Pelagibacteraceae bacterium]MBG77001.1 hypothetical protein [Pelagibacteraceae bacterium]MBH90906.1 hypothetical protein [Candidatus Neomarinimicrobiota bacterium]PPR42050.1 MAG: hypothetical protein CFH22_00119 [Alphaproteobacteria bacterium MarineAlpha5_Bin12]|tara:strand:- start:7104 stop:7733 length:630 start_codon:yes stop_codon:yes gene_type:complete
MNEFLNSLKNSVRECNKPFQHWEINKPLTQNIINEIISVKIPEGQHAYDGTRAADYSGGGIDNKLRIFVDKKNCHLYPELKSLIKTLQSKSCQNIVSNYLNKDISKSYVRLEVIADKIGFWLKPHKDIKEKIMTMMLWINNYDESENLGTDFYDESFNLVKTSKYIHNTGYFFSSGNDTWHGLEKKSIKKERRCIQINYVSFKTDWPVE